MSYREEFPDFDNSPAASTILAAGFVDSSWRNEQMPNFIRKNAQVWANYINPELRMDDIPYTYAANLVDDTHQWQLSLETESLSEALAFADALNAATIEQLLSMEFERYTVAQGLCLRSDALELLMFTELSANQRKWLSQYVVKWDLLTSNPTETTENE